MNIQKEITFLKQSFNPQAVTTKFEMIIKIKDLDSGQSTQFVPDEGAVLQGDSVSAILANPQFLRGVADAINALIAPEVVKSIGEFSNAPSHNWTPDELGQLVTFLGTDWITPPPPPPNP